MNADTQLILEKLGQIDERLDRLESKVDRLEIKVDQLEIKVGEFDVRVGKLEATTSSLVVEVTRHGQILSGLITRKEFEEFKNQTLTHFDGLSGKMEHLEQEMVLLQAA